MGIETSGDLEAAIIGAQKGMDWIKICLDYYENKHFYSINDTFDIRPLPSIMTNIFKSKFIEIPDNISKKIEMESIKLTLYPSEYFSPKNIHFNKIKITNNTYTIHHFDGNWVRRNYFYYIKLFFHQIVILLFGQKIHNHFVKKIIR
jgi:hypothetical protein